ncbi:MAG: class I SAM-dependent methyltransferase [Phycisphaeraceae bacterium]
MATLTLTHRQHREAEYYRQFTRLNPVDTVDFAPVLSDERRPWSPYWRLCQRVRDLRTAGPQRLLDFGCGWGIASVTFAKLGFAVEGFDIADANIAASQRLAEKYELADRCRFRVMPAEKLDYPDACFDVVVGIDVLHHVELPLALTELRRVLKPGGVALFKEPFVAPVLERIRTSPLVEYLVPRAKSYEKHVHITDDERKLTRQDAQLLAQAFEVVSVDYFSLANRLARLMPRHYPTLMRIDHLLFRLCPPLRHLGDVRIMQYRRAA